MRYLLIIFAIVYSFNLIGQNEKHDRDPLIVKLENGENGFDELVNSAFISGKYLSNGNEVVFKTNGTINGLENF